MYIGLCGVASHGKSIYRLQAFPASLGTDIKEAEAEAVFWLLRIRRLPKLEVQDRLWNLVLSLPMIGFLLVFFILPFAFIFLYAFGFYNSSYQWTGNFSLANFDSVLTESTLDLFTKTASVAGIVTAMSLLFGYPVAYYLASQPTERREFLLMLLIIPFWTSFLLRTFALMTIFHENGLMNQLLESIGLSRDPVFRTRNLLSVIWAETYTFMPFMVLPLYATLERMSRSSIEASYLLGAGRVQTFLRVILPLSLPGIMAGTLLVFIISMGELVIPSLTGGVQYGYLLGNAIYERAGQSPGPMAALSLVFMVIVTVTAFAYLRIAGREGLRL